MTKRILLALTAVLALASAALAQNPPNLPAGNNVWGRMSPVAGPSSAISLNQVQAAILYGETTVSDANYAMVAADRNIVYTAISATRTVTLLPASTFSAGFKLLLMDRSGNAALAKNITVAPTGADTINNVNSSAVAVSAPFGGVTLESDGQSKWTIITTAPSGAGSGTVTNIATGTGLTGGPITSTGTISIANTITAAGPIGSGTLTPVLTFNAQGQLTTVTTATTAPPFSAVTGQATLAQFPTIGANTVLGSIAGGTPIALTPTQLTTLCNTFTASLAGCVPGSGGGSSNFLRSDGSWTTPAGGGTVTNVALALPASILTVSGSPVTTTGTLTGTLATQSANTIWAGPTSGGVVAPTFRALVVADLPSITNNTVLGNISGGSSAPSALSASQLTTLCNTFTSLLPGCVPSSGGGTSNFLRADGTWTTPAGGGTVTNIATGTGLSGGPITTTGTIALAGGVPTNTLRTVTANDPVVNTDCGKTLQLGTGSTGFFTETVPSVSGFSSTCVVALFNGDTARGKAISGDPGCSSRNILWPGQTCIIGIVNGAWAVLSRPGRWRPNAGGTLNFFTDFTNGSDTAGGADGLASGASAFKSVEMCFLNAADQIDFNTATQTSVVCNMAAATSDTQGMHSPVHALTGAQGGSAFQVAGASLAVTGAVTNGGLCKITVSSTASYSANQVVSVYDVGGATGCNGTWKVTVTDGTHLTLQNTTFGGAYTSGGTVTNGSVMSVTGNAAMACYFGTVIQFSNVYFQSNVSNISPDHKCFVYILKGNILGGSPAVAHIFMQDQSQIHLNGNVGIATTATNALAQVQKQAMLVADFAVNIDILPGINPNFGVLATLYADNMSMINASNWTFNLNGNTVTGTRCNANQNSLIVSNGTPNTQFPGNVNCTSATGGTVN